MDICIYYNYKIEMNVKGSKQVGYDEFKHFEYKRYYIKRGWGLIEDIGNYLNNAYIQSINFKDDTLEISFFNHNTGEGSDYTLKITPISLDGEE